MRKVMLAMALLICAVPAFAREKRSPIHTVRSPHRPVIHRLAAGHEGAARVLAQAQAAKLTPAAIADNRSSRAIVFPAAGNAAGANGTYFRSDVTLVNLNDKDQDITGFWFPNGNPEGTVAFTATLPTGPPVTYVDFIGAELELTGVGALLILPTVDGFLLDPNGAIDGYSRIWSPAPAGSSGTFSQPFPAVDFDHLRGEYEALILGMRQDAGFRTNYGIVNMSGVDIPFEVLIIDNDGELVSQFSVTVRQGEMILRPIPAGAFGNISILVAVAEDIEGDAFEWTTFASSTDNFNGDGWVSIGSKPYDDDDLDTDS